MKKITIIPGDGIGPSIMKETLRILDHMKLDLEYDFQLAGESAYKEFGELLPEKTIESIKKNKIVLKSPLTTPVGEGFKSINVTLRQMFDLYTNLRPVKSITGLKEKFDDIDIVTVRENTQGIYAGKGQVRTEDSAEATSFITVEGCDRIIKYAFEYAIKNNRKSVSLFHKANIIKSVDGLFLERGRLMAQNYPTIEFKEYIMDNACMQLFRSPHQFDVIVAMNLFGDLTSDICAALVGGLGFAPGANIGKEHAIFEAVHGSAPDIAGRNIANPSSLLLSACMMLDHLNYEEEANSIRRALNAVVAEGVHTTGDIGGSASTTEFADAIISKLDI